VVATAATTWMRRAARLLGIGALALAHAAIAQAESVAEAASELEQLCRTVLCRKPTPVH